MGKRSATHRLPKWRLTRMMLDKVILFGFSDE
jgi:hypothetical protein